MLYLTYNCQMNKEKKVIEWCWLYYDNHHLKFMFVIYCACYSRTVILQKYPEV